MAMTLDDLSSEELAEFYEEEAMPIQRPLCNSCGEPIDSNEYGEQTQGYHIPCGDIRAIRRTREAFGDEAAALIEDYLDANPDVAF